MPNVTNRMPLADVLEGLHSNADLAKFLTLKGYGNFDPRFTPTLDLNFRDPNFDASALSVTNDANGTYRDHRGIQQNVANTPRINWKYIDDVLQPDGLLLEPSSSNATINSEDLTLHSKSRVTITSDSIASPFYGVMADKIVEDNTTGLHHVLATGITARTGTATQSVFVKAGERTNAVITTDFGAGGWIGVLFVNLITGEIEAKHGGVHSAVALWYSSRAKTEYYGDGWWRVSVDFDQTTESRSPMLRVGPNDGSNFTVVSGSGREYTGDGSSGIYAFGLQTELNISNPTSYIPTTTTAVTRAVDTITLSTSGKDKLPAGSPVTLIVDTGYIWNGARESFLNVEAGADTFAGMRTEATGGITFSSTFVGAHYGGIALTLGEPFWVRYSASYDGVNRVTGINSASGGLVIKEAVDTDLPTITDVDFNGTTFGFKGPIVTRSLRVMPTALSAADIKEVIR